MDKSLKPKTVDEHAQPYKLMYNLLYTKGQFLIIPLIVIGEGIDIDKSQVHILIW
jgi:hypothetical protein